MATPGKSPTRRWQIALGQNIELLAIKDPDTRLWYAEATQNYGWSRPALAVQIDPGLHERHGQAITNFDRVLPPETSDLAQQMLKDPCQFNFLTPRVARVLLVSSTARALP